MMSPASGFGWLTRTKTSDVFTLLADILKARGHRTKIRPSPGVAPSRSGSAPNRPT